MLSETGETKELIKAYLVKYSPRPHYVLLVGDTSLIPAWPTETPTGFTDLYYTTFDRPPDMTPNVILGRLPVQNVAQLTALVAKYIAYDQMSYGETWHRQLSFISDANEDYYEKVENIHEVVVEHYTAPLGYSGTFPGADDLPAPIGGGDRLYPLTYGATKPDLLTVIDEGRVMLVYNGKGSPTEWQWKTDDDFTVADVQSLSGTPVPLVLALADKTANFNEEVSMADAWLLHGESGALVYIGASIETFALVDTQIEQLFFDQLFADPIKPASIGDAFFAALDWVRKYNPSEGIQEMEAYQLLGDPSLQIPWPEPFYSFLPLMQR